MASPKKSAAGSGNIRKKAIMRNGKEYSYWEARVTVGFDPETGRQRQRSVSGKTQKEVAQKLRQLTTEIDQGTYLEPTKMTVGEWLDAWLDQSLGGIKPRTAALYKDCVRLYLKPTLGAVKLDKLKPADIQGIYTGFQRRDPPLSAKTIKNIHGVLHKALQQAVEMGYLHNNPSAPCKLPRVEKAPIQPLDTEQIKAFLEAVEGNAYENAFLVTLFTGMRQGEILGLKWEYVNFDKGIILIAQQLQRRYDGSGGYRMVSPKNGKTRRITPAPFVMEILKQQQVKQAQWKATAGELWEEEGFVFTNEIGQHLRSQTLYHHFKRLAAKIGCPNARYHDLRHSYAVASLQAGDDIKTVQENLGHHTAAFTLDVYGHVTDQMRQNSADRMQQFIDSISGQKGKK